MVRMFVFTAAMLSAGVIPALAQQLPPQPPPVASPLIGQGNDQERAACRPDVMRFCRQLIKDNQDDVFSILECLQSNRTRISAPCQRVLASHGQ